MMKSKTEPKKSGLTLLIDTLKTQTANSEAFGAGLFTYGLFKKQDSAEMLLKKERAKTSSEINEKTQSSSNPQVDKIASATTVTNYKNILAPLAAIPANIAPNSEGTREGKTPKDYIDLTNQTVLKDLSELSVQKESNQTKTTDNYGIRFLMERNPAIMDTKEEEKSRLQQQGAAPTNKT